MIQNDKQLEITKRWLNEFQQAMNQTIESTIDPALKKLYLDTQQSTIDTFNSEIEEYETKGPIIWEKEND